MQKILFYSTNRKAPEVDLINALFTGQAPDRGLYMPKTIPMLSQEEIAALADKTYAQVAAVVLGKYTLNSLSPDTLLKLCEEAYDYPVPLEHVQAKTYLMRLDQGPTASFKDFAARMMARLFGTFLKKEKRQLVILTATSGDTGSAIANAFYAIPNIKVMVLFPPSEVSNRQRKQMTTLGKNVTIVGIDGKFDDCQALVKKAFTDNTLKEIWLTSANSINMGRLLPQTVYYFYAYSQLGKDNEPVYFSIPSGNFGNMMGALLAKRMGLPIERLIIVTNANNEVPVYFKTRSYQKIVPSRVCISNAMNVGHPSNFARVIDLYGGWMDETGTIHQQPDIEHMRRDMWTISIDDKETRETIRSAWGKYRLMLEPHGATGWAGLQHFIRETKTDGLMVSVETAHPAKFPEEIEQLLSITPPVPKSMIRLEEMKESYLQLPIDYQRFHHLLLEKYRR
ncbi:threonine synthase [bacterium]|nr:threonine synthase [bacterium]RQV99154.1 MAG: threonine synthase [bacterium]